MNIRYLLIGVVLTAGIAGGIFLMKKNQPVMPGVQATVPETKLRGAANAKVQIIEYSDFQCPACQKAEAPIQRVLSTYPNDVQLVFRHFPLPGHLWSGVAHQAAECANEAGRFWDYHDRLYAEQSKWSGTVNPTETFLTYARDMGFNLHKFAACLSDQTITRRIIDEKQKGNSLKVSSTPTFVIQGERLVGPVEFDTKAEVVIRRLLGLPEKTENQQPADSSVPPT